MTTCLRTVRIERPLSLSVCAGGLAGPLRRLREALGGATPDLSDKELLLQAAAALRVEAQPTADDGPSPPPTEATRQALAGFVRDIAALLPPAACTASTPPSRGSPSQPRRSGAVDGVASAEAGGGGGNVDDDCGWQCGFAGCGGLANKAWAEEINADKVTCLFCAAHFDEAERPPGWCPAVTLQYGPAKRRTEARMVGHAFGPQQEANDETAPLRQQLTEESEQYLAFKERVVGERRDGTLNGGRELLQIAMEGRHADWVPAWVAEPRAKPKTAARRRRPGAAARLTAVKKTKERAVIKRLTQEQQHELEERYDKIAGLVRQIITTEERAGTLEKLMHTLRPGVAFQKTVIPRAIELILATPGAAAQFAHKDFVESTQVQVGLVGARG